jgi:hypothetical protein
MKNSNETTETEPNTNPLAFTFDRLRQALPATGGRELGYRDALESIVMALHGQIDPKVLDDAVTTALDAWGNNCSGEEDGVVLDLNIYEHGNVLDSNTVTVSRAHVSAIVDHAAEVILIGRAGGGDHQAAMSNLEEALVQAQVVIEDNEFELESQR